VSQPNQTEMFRCDRQAVTLTVGGCARMWRSAREKRPAPWEGRSHCVGCPIGATHAGDTQEEAAKARASEALRRICPRCIRPASRLINGRWCISCYNRVREVARGRNAKGNLPVVVIGRLHAVALTVSRPWPSNHPSETETFSSVTSRTEAMILAAKREAGAVFFGRPTLHHASAAA
jgi:hypothetical protein